MHRVALTGIGLLTPLGTGEAFWQALLERAVATAPVSRFDASGYPCRVAAEITGFDPADYMEPRRIKWTDRFAQFAIAASRMAIDDADFHLNGNGNDVSVFVGSALGGLAFAEEQSEAFAQRGLDAVRPLLAISVFGGASIANIAMEFGFTGPNIANANSCASGAVAIGQAYAAIARGETRAAIAGGVEAPLSPLVYGAFTVINAMSRRNDEPQYASRPFDRDRDGFVMAEGAGMFLLERYDDAVRRNAHIYAEISGFGLSNDAYHPSAPRPDGAQVTRAMHVALQTARLTPDEVEALNAHGSSTPLGDRSEARAFARLFGEGATQLPVSATKGQHGHALGATGAWEVGISAYMMRDGIIPGAVNFANADDDPDALVPSATPVQCRPRVVLSNSSGFGGINAALVLQHT